MADSATVTGKRTILTGLNEAGIVLLFPAACTAAAALPFRVQPAESCFTDSWSNRDRQSSVVACGVLCQSSTINRFSRFDHQI